MIGLFDRDVFLKLGCCNLWDEAVAALGVTRPYRLQATSTVRSNNRVVARLLGDVDHSDANARIAQMVAAVPVLADEMIEGIAASASYQLLSDVEGIDGGEQVLAAVLLNNPEQQILVSGDKKFVRALRGQLPQQWDIVEGRIISFEMCLLAIEEVYGFDYLLARVDPVKHCDDSLRLAIGHAPSSENFREGMKSFNPCRAIAVAEVVEQEDMDVEVQIVVEE